MSSPKLPSEEVVRQLLSLFENERYAELEAAARRQVKEFPAFGLGWKLLGAAMQMQGKEAVEALTRAADLLPGDIEVQYNLAVTLQAGGRLADAAVRYRQVLALQAALPEAHYSLAYVLMAQGEPEEAITHCHRALELKPDFAEAHDLLGGALQTSGRLADAEQSFRRAVEIRPQLAGAWSNLGNVQLAQGRGKEAIASYQRALHIQPAHAEAQFNLGNALSGQGRKPEAAEAYRRALAQKPDFTGALNNLGDVLRDLGALAEAEACCRRALQLRPDYAEALLNLGNALKDQGQIDEAIEAYRRAIDIKPGFAGAHNNLGGALEMVWRSDEAVVCYRRALELDPEYAEASNHLGNALKDLGQLDAAVAAYRRALALKPDLLAACDNLLFTLNYHPDIAATELAAAYSEYDIRFCSQHRAAWRPHANERSADRRLRIGYVSPDFRRHVTRHFLEPLLANHDKRVVETFAYADLAREDEVTLRYKGYVDHWRATRAMGDEQLAQQIRGDRIDILVDLAGHTAGNRLPVFARKPAPVLVSWIIGSGSTTGMSAFDYLLVDEVCAPPGSEAYFTEPLWRLDRPVYAYRPDPVMGEVTGLPASTRGHVTFGTLTRAVRLNDRTIALWARVLKRVGAARLVVDSGSFRDAASCERLRHRFEAHGIDGGRIAVGYHSPPWDVLRGIDIVLDCFPQNSGTTLFEGLYLGIPFVTLADRPGVGRLGATILTGAGHPEWIAATEAEYVDTAAALAGNLPRLADIRRNLRGDMQRSALMDETGLARAIEAAYRRMFERWSGP